MILRKTKTSIFKYDFGTDNINFNFNTLDTGVLFHVGFGTYKIIYLFPEVIK